MYKILTVSSNVKMLKKMMKFYHLNTNFTIIVINFEKLEITREG